MTASLLAAKLALGPILLPQAHWLRLTALRMPEPEGPREGTVGAGAPAARVLVLGDSSAAGVGVADQAQALALPLAHGLHERLGAAVGWQLVAKTGVNASQAHAMLASAPLHPAGVAVVALGVNDVSSQTSAGRFTGQMEQLWEELRGRTGARWAVFCGLPPMHMLPAVPRPLRWYLGRYADWLDDALVDWTQSRGLGYCGLRWASDPAALALDGFHPGPRLYPQWARRLADLLMSQRERWAQPK